MYRLLNRTVSTRSDLTTDEARSGGILEAVERAKVFRLCLRRIWAVSASLPGGAQSLPSLIPAPGMFSVPSHNRQHHEHEQCTFDFCEHSRIDFTSVAQRHEGCKGDCGNYTFPLDQLIDRVERGRFTAWKLVSASLDDAPSLLDSTHPYMAVSHVWADGTGAGIWGPGKVNKCLYKFFCGIAREFQCEGCWWDTISIPRDDEVRSKALNTMHNNYAAARITLVHDLYLREWEWVDAEMACFAVVMSPWYSRGWTALELAKSHKVKILFKARNDRYLIKDLDVDILAEIPPSSPHHATADAIRKLRSARIQNFGDLLSILGPRDTSKPRDIPIISGLLAGVDVSGGLSQQEIYQRILRKLGKVAQGHLFHNSATMAAPGFGWCPTNILDMPMADMEPKSVMLELRENGDLEGRWRAYSIDSVEADDFIWQSTHALTQASLRSALTDENKDKHILLAESGPQRYRALLVRPMKCEEETTNVIYCRFVGPVYFRSKLGSSNNKDDKGQDIEVRISNTEKMQEIDDKAWKYVCETIEEHKATDEAETTGRDSGVLDEDDPGSQDLKALLFLGRNMETASPQLCQESRFPSSDTSSKQSDDMVMYCQNNIDSSASIQVFFYGNEGIIKYVKPWLEEKSNVKTEQMMLLLLDENVKIKVNSSKFPAQDPLLGGTALQLAAENGADGRSESLVTLLLDNGAPYVQNVKGQWPIHSAVEKANVGIVQRLLTNTNNPADPNVENADRQRAIHLAAKNDRIEIAKRLVESMEESLDAQDRNGQTALIVAAEKGRPEIVRLLLEGGASPNITDLKKHIALHHAALNGHRECVWALLEHAKAECRKEVTRPESAHSVAPDDRMKPTRRSDEESDRHTNDDPHVGGGGHSKPSGESDARQMLAKKANLNFQNEEGKTALHLASQKGKSDVVEILLNQGANLSAADSQKQTALILAAKHGKAKTVQILLQCHNWEQEELDVALLSAAAKLSVEDKDKGSPEKVIDELIRDGARLGRQDSDGMTALHWAIKAKDESIAEKLINTITQEGKHLDTKENKKQQSALLMAVDSGLNKAVMAMLKKGADTESKDSRKRTALHWAAVRRNVDVARALLDKQEKSMADEQDVQGRTPLHLAAHSGEAKLTELLLVSQANPLVLDIDHQSALMLAAGLRRVDAVKALLCKKNDLTTRDKNGKSALDLAATKGFNDVVVELLNSTKMEDDMANEQALELAAKEGHLLVSITLYEQIKDSKLRELAVSTILFSAAAAASESTSVIERLIKMVTNPNHKGKDGRTALMLAVLNNKWQLFNKLLDLKANPDLQDNEKRTALMMAAEIDHWAAVEALLRANANPNIQDEQGYTALHYAAEGEKSRSLPILLGSMSKVTNANVQDSRKRTALHIALEKLKPPSRYNQFIFLRRYRDNNNWHLLLRYGARPDIQDEEGQTPLHWAVRKDRIDIAKLLLEANPSDNPVNLDIPDAEGRTPLLLAAEGGNSDLVYFLLEDYNFKADRQDKTGRTPLLLAAEGGDEESVMTLLEKNANPNIPDRQSRTPLLQASRNGYWRVVRYLIQDQKREEANLDGRDKREKANLDARDSMGRTALMLAAENGHDQIVTDLQNEGANSSLIDYEGKKAWQRAMDKGHAAVVGSLLSKLDAPTQDMTAVNEALLLASRRGWTELVNVLLQQEADVTFQGDEGWTALHMAAMGGHHEVIKILLKKGVSVVIKDKKDRTALMQATEHGFESIVELLLAREEVNNNIGGWMGPEALRCAAEKGNKGIVSLLLKSNVNRNGTDPAGRTAMALAAANGNQEIVDFLLLKGANPDLKDNQSRAALHHAAWGGHDDVVRILLEREVEINALDDGEQAALHLAAERASTRVVSLLLKKGANANARSRDGQTALHRAAWGGSRDVVKLLRKSGADPFIRDSSNNKPWQVAAEKGHESIVETLLEEEESIQDELISQKKGLIFASQKGYTAMANALLNKGAETMVKDQDGFTPLHWAAKRGDHAMVELLIKREGPIKTLDIQDNYQRTPLCMAVWNGRATVVRILLENGADPNIPNEKGQTVLHIAAAEGNGEIVQILDNHKADPHARDDQRQKAWLLAAKAGNHQIVRLLLKREVDLNPQSRKIEELFLQMAARGFVLMVHLLLENGVNKDATDRLGRVAIGLAAEEEKDDVVELLLKKKANPGLPDSNRQTPLLWAAKSGNLRIMNLLLDNITSKSSDQEPPQSPRGSYNSVPNGNVQTLTTSEILNHTDSQGQTALLIAIQNKHDEAVKLLLHKGLAHGINLDLKDTTGRTALHLVAETGNDNLIGHLLEKSASQTLQDTLGRTALFLAAENYQNTAVESLLRSSRSAVEIPDSHQRTALQVAAERGNSSMTKTLLEYGAKRDHQDGLGRTALLLAAENGEKEVVDLLLKEMAKQELADSNGHTPLLLAVANGDKAIVKALLEHPKADLTVTDKNGRSLLHLAVQSGNKDVAWLIAEQMTQLQGATRSDELW